MRIRGKGLLPWLGMRKLATWGMMEFFMKHKILTWNVRGLNEGNKRMRVRRLLSQWKVDIVCLQETKLEMITTSLVQSLWRCPYAEWCFVPSIGASGGILLMWHRRVVSKVDVCVGTFVAASLFRNVEEGLEWAFARVYGPNRNMHRRRLWKELAGVLSLWDVPWCIRGDFNVTLFHSERSGDARRRSAVIAFDEFIAEQGLMDLSLSGGCLRGLITGLGPGWIGSWSLRSGN
jgi:hypothetical protein